MIEGWWQAVGCPYCQSTLQPAGDLTETLTCSGCGERFSSQGRIPTLMRHEDLERLTQFARDYRDARARQGWGPLAHEQALLLPYARPLGYPSLYWEVRRQSFCALMSLLAREGPSPAAGLVADLGAGFGWLTFRLAQVGYRVVAVEASADPEYGLGAAEAYYGSRVNFLPIQGDLEYPPLPVGGLALAILNASLHYARDLEGTLERCTRALGPRGRLIALDTPMARWSRQGTGQGDRHLSMTEMNDALAAAGMRPRWIRVRRGLRWSVHQFKAWLRHDPRFSFPIVVADRL